MKVNIALFIYAATAVFVAKATLPTSCSKKLFSSVDLNTVLLCVSGFHYTSARLSVCHVVFSLRINVN